MNEVWKKYKDITVLVNDDEARGMAKAVVESNQFALEQMFAMSSRGGDIIVCANKDQNSIMELVVGQSEMDSAVTLYAPHSVFNSPGTLLKAREEVIQELHKLRPDAAGVQDPIRKRPVLLIELGFAQLIDLLGQISNPVAEAA